MCFCLYFFCRLFFFLCARLVMFFLFWILQMPRTHLANGSFPLLLYEFGEHIFSIFGLVCVNFFSD